MFNQKASPARSLKSGNSATSSTPSTRSMPSPKTTANGTAKTATTSVPKVRAQLEKTSISSAQSSFEDDAPIPEGLVRCSICKRNFAEDRIETHQVICQKNKVRKRRVYDASKKRVQVCVCNNISVNVCLNNVSESGNRSRKLLEETNLSSPSCTESRHSYSSEGQQLALQA